MKILVADDDIALGNLYKQVFEAEKIEVDLAEDGEKALVLIQKGGYDLILIDVKMPKMDGFALVEASKKVTPASPNGPIFFLTNSEDEMAIAQGVSLEVQGYLIKSQYDSDTLVKEVKRIIEEAKLKAVK